MEPPSVMVMVEFILSLIILHFLSKIKGFRGDSCQKFRFLKETRQNVKKQSRFPRGSALLSRPSEICLRTQRAEFA